MSLNIEVLDNFLNEKDLSELQALKLEETPDKKMNVYVKKIEGNSVSGTGMSEKTVIKLQENYHSKAMALLNKLNPDKANLLVIF